MFFDIFFCLSIFQKVYNNIEIILADTLCTSRTYICLSCMIGIDYRDEIEYYCIA